MCGPIDFDGDERGFPTVEIEGGMFIRSLVRASGTLWISKHFLKLPSIRSSDLQNDYKYQHVAKEKYLTFNFLVGQVY